MRKWPWLAVLALGWLPGVDAAVPDLASSRETKRFRAERRVGPGHLETGRGFLVWDEDAEEARAWAEELRATLPDSGGGSRS